MRSNLVKFLILTVFILSGFFVFTDTALATEIIIDHDTVWSKGDVIVVNANKYLGERGIKIALNATLTINAGAIIKLFPDNFIDVEGNLIISGTANDLVIITSVKDDSAGGDTNQDGSVTQPTKGDWGKIQITNTGSVIINYASIKYGGAPEYQFDFLPSMINIEDQRANLPLNLWPKTIISNSLIGESAGYGIYDKGWQTIITKNKIFKNNNYGIRLEPSYKNEITYNDINLNGFNGPGSYRGGGILMWRNGIQLNISNNNFHNNTVGFNNISGVNISLINNWWGSNQGPITCSSYCIKSGERDSIIGLAVYQPFLTEEWQEPANPDPVIIIPGILGSWKVKGEWKIDPIFNTYSNLIEAFISAGYKTQTIFNNDPSLFIFPYDWRVDNNITASLLRDKIQEIKTLTGSSKVDIVAHSMGGLVARSYIQGTNYNNDVDQVIFLGVPHLGSPESYLTLIGGYFKGKIGLLKEIYFTQEAIRNGYFDLTKYIQEQVPTVGQLLPIYSYLKDNISNGFWAIRNYPANYPRNEFLENLNRSDQLELLKQRVDITNIVSGQGSASASSTLRYIRVVPDTNTNDSKWQYGYPINLDQSEGAFEAGNGDGTVPYESANALTGVRTISLYSNDHNELPTVMQQYIIEILTGKKPIEYFDAAMAYAVSRWSIFRVYSPVDFVIVAPDGRRVGKDFVNSMEINEIENAFYTGFGDHTEFVLIPNPQDGEYRVELQGVEGGGEYTLATSFIDENNPQLNSEIDVKSFIASSTIDSFKVNYTANSPQETIIESEVDFQKLIALTDYFYNNGQISKKAVYNFLISNLKELSHKYDKILSKAGKHDLEDDDHSYNREKSENYYERELSQHDDNDSEKKDDSEYNDIKKQLKHMIEKVEFYYHRNWIDGLAKNILISNINLLIKKL